MRSNTGDVKANLQAILQHSIIKTEKDLLHELDAMEKLKTGTKILISQLAHYVFPTLQFGCCLVRSLSYVKITLPQRI
jgi:hypothetical protein